ncbi:hypothetical protein PGTUg99_032664 [Puccinia graminis f. sp. tritici]|uniref:F-box domain-containing protein n=1 Tax=Puccinia graminis f. sp. tritici TaxID=56615 RepID=A0A5B0SM70_PUCGR|nr:hypothetical protein PGTUg99_032664 [Puccinia graminis f. sp. tritici]
MPDVLDLPWHVFEVIYKNLTKDGDFSWPIFSNQPQSAPGTRSTTGKLRLVCRQWADWLYVHHLYRTMTFESASRAMRFIVNQITRRSKSLPRARCQHLQVLGILTWGPAPPHQGSQRSSGFSLASRRKPEDTITFEILEALVELFSDTIVELNLRFWNVMSLPSRTIGTIGRIENLRALRLGHELPEVAPAAPQPRLFPLYHDSDDEDIEEAILQHNARLDMDEMFGGGDRPPTDMDPVKSKIDSDCFKSLILATRKLQSLDITDLDPICLPKPIKSTLCSHHVPTITQLEVSLEGQSLSRLIDLSIMLKGTLNVLSLQDRWQGNHSRNLVPVFENLRENLEGLFVTDEKILKPVMKLKFPKLRVFKTIFWDGHISNLLEKPMIASSPIEVLALQSEVVDCRPKGKFRVNPFLNLPTLRRLVFCEVRPGYAPPPAYIKACNARRVKCVYLSPSDGEDVSLIMLRDAGKKARSSVVKLPDLAHQAPTVRERTSGQPANTPSKWR